uniref:HMG box-containing protein C19G7.04-like n=1 Tax=Crassostrea virginica TaxID=6565 RepID=A0A8B8D7V9_CRAVI|nr:HMG box-containing protein C19G7.04-like [Crassostrea virginica]XP_022323638.1 HMG box-containing protein C19G7.04-like [Crassostrea virginica]XP_022323639.1 HMG box-containing protein C19G7.04-like [Crassostrea virginica]XP_022323640.1 HMG box-containing protein C19G7.04-like [Crassostrea virginica]
MQSFLQILKMMGLDLKIQVFTGLKVCCHLTRMLMYLTSKERINRRALMCFPLTRMTLCLKENVLNMPRKLHAKLIIQLIMTTGGLPSITEVPQFEEEELESFFQKMKAPKHTPEEDTPQKNRSLDDFIVDDDDVSSSDNDADFYITTSSVFTTPHRKVDPILLDDSEDDIFKSDIRPIKRRTKEKPQRTPVSSKKRPEGMDEKGESGGQKYSFLRSLSSDTPEELGDREALRYSRNFKKMKEDLTLRLFKIYNDTVFDNQLPGDLQILWNNRLLKTAGYCVYKKNSKVHDSKSVRIELSTKVCDSAERVRDTLIHELCHAAVWLLHGKNDGHGPYWRIWAKKANLTHPEIPVIARCHSYSITTKYTYQCKKCGYSIGRHSKSLDTSRKVCGFCHGEFALIDNRQLSRGSGSTPATPRTPNKFAMYVKENYGSMKEQEKDLKHGDIMKRLGKQFAEKNKISS